VRGAGAGQCAHSQRSSDHSIHSAHRQDTGWEMRCDSCDLLRAFECKIISNHSLRSVQNVIDLDENNKCWILIKHVNDKQQKQIPHIL
jgi:hypothetical protein